MAIPTGTRVRLWGVFTSEGRLVNTMNDVVVDVYVIANSTTNFEVVAGPAIKSGDKYYYDYITTFDAEDVHATFKTEDMSLDFFEVPSLGLSLEKIQDDINKTMTPYGHFIIGQGRGSEEYTDILTGARGNVLVKYFVKAYSKVNGSYDFNTIVAMDETDGTGEYTLFLNPGDYILSIEKGGVQVDTTEITITE